MPRRKRLLPVISKHWRNWLNAEMKQIQRTTAPGQAERSRSLTRENQTNNSPKPDLDCIAWFVSEGWTTRAHPPVRPSGAEGWRNPFSCQTERSRGLTRRLILIWSEAWTTRALFPVTPRLRSAWLATLGVTGFALLGWFDTLNAMIKERILNKFSTHAC